MLPVAKLDITEFRGIKKCQKPLEFAKFNVLLGRNNSGKSAVLQALSLLPFPSAPLPMSLSFPGVGASRISLLQLLTGGVSSMVYRYAGIAVLDFEVNEKKLSLTLDSSGNPKITTKGGITQQTTVVEVARDYLGIEPPQSSRYGNWAVLVPNDSQFLRTVESQLFNSWDSIVKSGSHRKVILEVVNPSIDEHFTEVLKSEAELRVRKESEGVPFYVKVRDLGDGVKKTLSILLFLDFCSPGVVLWDDFEISAHPSLVKYILLWLCQKDWQVVLATHSIDALYELVEIKPEDARIIQLRKTADDILSHNILTIEDVEDFLSASNDPRLLIDLVQ